MKGKFIRKYSFLLIMPLLLLTGFAPVKQASAIFRTTNEVPAPKPVFSSSFIQHWYCEDFDQLRWEQELGMMKKKGINEIILQAIAYTDTKYAVYPTRMLDYRHNDIDMLSNVLTVADSLSMNVRIGLAFNDAWWSKKAFDMEWLNNEAEINKIIVGEIVGMYGGHPSFTGWYIPHEFSQITAPTVRQQVNLNSFFTQIASEIKLKSPGKDIMVSPFYSSKYSWVAPLPIWSTMVENIIKDTGVDILALQDAVGVGYNTTNQLDNIFTYTKMAADAAGIRFYSVTETFTTTPSGFVTAPQESITSQLSIVKPYVQGFVAFSINHYQNANISKQLKNSSDYYDYYIANR
jgi:hypothetical protein